MSEKPGSEPPRKRQRKAKSCEQCRNRKVRCDQTLPCGPCRRSREHLSCTYRDGLRSSAAAAFPVHGQPSTGEEAALEHPSYPYENGRLELAGGEATELGASSSTAWTAATASATATGSQLPRANRFAQQQSFSPNPEMAAQSDRISSLDERVRRLEAGVCGGLKRGGLRSDTAVLNTPERLGLTIDPAMPRLRFTQDKVKIFPQSHWIHTAEKVFDLASFTSEVEPTLGLDREEWTKAYKELRDLRSSVKRQQLPKSSLPLDFSDLHATLPAREVCDTLVSSYLRTFERIYRVLNIPKFLEDYDQFWSRPSSLPKSFAVKLVLILATGTAFARSSQSNAESVNELQRQAQQWIYTAQWWLAGPTGKSTQNLHGLQIFCLLVVARQATGIGSSPSVSAASLLSLAMQMGLHRNARNLQALSRSHAETMARLWATVRELYLASCLDSGAPVQVTFEIFDALEPSNLNDSEVTEGGAYKAPTVLVDRITDTSLPLLLLRSQGLRAQALKIINSIGSQTSYEDVVELVDQIRSACSEATAFFSTHFSNMDTDEMFHKKYIDVYLRRHILLLHRPFMLAAAKDPRFYLSRKMCLESCMIMASSTDEIELPSKTLDHFSSLMAQGSGHLRGGLSLDVSMTLAYELNAQYQEDGSVRGSGSYDPARELASAAREPLMRRLKHIREVHAQIIALGNPSLKRFVMVSAALAQIKTLEVGGDMKTAFYAAVKEAMLQCTKSLEVYLTGQPSGQAVNPETEEPSFLEEYDFDLNELDFDTLIDPMSLFNAPVLS